MQARGQCHVMHWILGTSVSTSLTLCKDSDCATSLLCMWCDAIVVLLGACCQVLFTPILKSMTRTTCLLVYCRLTTPLQHWLHSDPHSNPEPAHIISVERINAGNSCQFHKIINSDSGLCPFFVSQISSYLHPAQSLKFSRKSHDVIFFVE
jgi:hypothetical protein